MRNVFSILTLIGILVFQACEGPEGPIGPQGEPGVVIVGSTIEVEIDFTTANDFMSLVETPFTLEDSDALLVYRLSAIDNGRDVWRLLPQTYFFQDGVLIYNFDYTVDDVSIFLDGAIDLNALAEEWRTDQIFRVIVVPADFAGNRIDFTNYDAVTKMLGIEDADFHKVQLKQKN